MSVLCQSPMEFGAYFGSQACFKVTNLRYMRITSVFWL